MMCSCLVLLILSIIAARVVDLPLPAGPVTEEAIRISSHPQDLKLMVYALGQGADV